MRKLKNNTKGVNVTLKLFLKSPGKWFSVAEVAKRAKVAKRTARMYLQFMKKFGILFVRAEGQRKFYQLKSIAHIDKFIDLTSKGEQ